MKARGPAAAEMARIRARMKQYDAMPAWARALVADHGFAKVYSTANANGWNEAATREALSRRMVA